MAADADPRSIADFPDIIYHVVPHLDPGRAHLGSDASKLARQSLARLARTHRNFAAPALKTLWRCLPNDKPLADLLCTLGISERHRIPNSESGDNNIPKFPRPDSHNIALDPDQLGEAPQNRGILWGIHYSYTLCGPDDPSGHPNWRRFAEYAAYVRTISGLFAFDGPKRLELWEDLGRRIAPAALLPRLEAVSFRTDIMGRREFSAGTFFLMSHSVTSLEYGSRATASSPQVHFAFARAFTSASEIQRVRIPIQPWENMHILRKRVSHVEVIPKVDSKRLKYLAQFQHLRSLSLSLKFHNPAEGDMLTYPRLETLNLKGYWTDQMALLNSTHAPKLRTLSLEVWQRGSAQLFAAWASQCLNTIPARCPFLTSLTVLVNASHPLPLFASCQRHPILDWTSPFSFLDDLVRPLLALRTLRTLTLILPNYIDFKCSSDELRIITEALRNLEALHIQLWDYFTLNGLPEHPGAGDHPCGGPFAAIAHFACNCPRLRTLHLPPMDATHLDVLDDALSISSRDTHGLENLVVSKLKIETGAGGVHASQAPQLTQKAEEFVKGVFPAAAWRFRKDGIALDDGWLVVREHACCLDCDDLQLSAQKL